jgi:hypothetical protein
VWSGSSIERQQVSKDLQKETPGAALLSEANGTNEPFGFKEFRESFANLERHCAGWLATEQRNAPSSTLLKNTIENKSQ